uniref:SusC/RagA family TonB-linked outer membrane protein n=1 Tax=Roseihalotalea indica TaxID=2867963 RepID=A0AA49JHT0_9BACT|nr:SusC/RagA family TonB-linked outer membrane protein [Tunicatimonas sp. TK19036]
MNVLPHHLVKSLLVCLICGIGMTHTLYGQKLASLSEPTRLTQDNFVPLIRVLSGLETKYHTQFSYDKELLAGKMVSNEAIKQMESDLDTSLTILLKPFRLKHERFDSETYIIYSPQDTPGSVKVKKKTSDDAEAGRNDKADPLQKLLTRHVIAKLGIEQIVRGTVSARSDNSPLPGVNVLVKGTTFGTVTDLDGNYNINVPNDDDTLIFSFIGYTAQEVPIRGRSMVDVALTEDIQSLEEVVVVGYGTMEKREVTSSVTSLKSRDLISGAVSPLVAVQGKVPGLNVLSTNGTDPNAGVSLQLRGVNSVLASQGPLIVIDGVPGGNINSVNRDDIESIDVLRDASAAAIYGTRASGGVILITTKNAKPGPATVSYTGEFFTETIRRRAETLSPEKFVEVGLGEDLGHRTDWYDEVTRDLPFSQRHVINVSGGSESARIYATVFTRRAEGIAIGSNRNEVGGRLNTDFQVLDGRGEISSNISYTNIDADFTSNGIFNMGLRLNPTETPYDPTDVTGYNVWTGGWDYYNPVADINLRTDENQYKNLLANISFRANITDHLSSSVMLAIKNDTEHPVFWRSSQHKTSREEGIDGYASQEYKRWEDKTFQWLVSYERDFGAHSINAVGGYNFQQFDGQGFSANNSNFAVDGLRANDMGAGTFLADGRAGMGSWKNPRVRLIAFFGRANYSFKDRYLLSASLRHEGSSKFAVGNKWGSFPAVSVGWRLSEESFMQNIAFLDDLKLRAGYGVTGNEGFSSSVATRMYGSDTWWLSDGEWFRTYGLSHNQNVGLQWETKEEYNFGLDFSILDNKLTGRVDVYQRDVNDLIYDISVAQPPAIHDKTTMNVGNLRNKGVEAELSWNAISRPNLSYNSSLIMSHNKSTLVTLWGSQTWWDRKDFPAPGSPGSAVRLYPGEDIGRFFIWKFAGFTEDGNWMLYDQEGNAFDVTQQSKSIEDKAFVGNAIPKVILSWNHSLTWKNFDLTMYMRGWFGHDVFNMINMYYSLPNVSGQNVLARAYEEHKDITGEKELSDYWLERGDFVKIDVLSLGYTFNTQSLDFINNLRVYATGRDLFTFTNYSGLDPEVDINGLEPGFEALDVYPKTRTFMLGVKANF